MILFGCALAGAGFLNPWVVYFSVVTGSLGGVMTLYWIGAGGRALFRLERFSLLNHGALERIEKSFARHGTWLLLLNRFLPGFRAFIFLFCGVAHLRARKVLPLGLLSIGAWNAILLLLGIYLGQDAETLLYRFSLVAVGFILLAILGLVLKRRFRL